MRELVINIKAVSWRSTNKLLRTHEFLSVIRQFWRMKKSPSTISKQAIIKSSMRLKRNSPLSSSKCARGTHRCHHHLPRSKPSWICARHLCSILSWRVRLSKTIYYSSKLNVPSPKKQVQNWLCWGHMSTWDRISNLEVNPARSDQVNGQKCLLQNVSRGLLSWNGSNT